MILRNNNMKKIQSTKIKKQRNKQQEIETILFVINIYIKKEFDVRGFIKISTKT